MEETPYPVHFTLAYEERASRLTTFFRGIMIIPHLVVLFFFEIAAAVLTVVAWFAILITGRYPAGMFGFLDRTLRYVARLNAYTYLMTDRWPAFGGGEAGDGYPVEYRADYPQHLSRLTTFFRSLLAIPAWIVAYALGIVVEAVAFVAWFAILFTGRLPRGLADVMVFGLRYTMRVTTYALLLTDRYPWFQPEQGESEGAGAVCAACGHANHPGAAFCANCGQPLT